MINIEKELVVGYIEDEFTALLEEINDIIIILDDRLLLSGLNNFRDISNLRMRLDRIKSAIKSLGNLSKSEHPHQQKLKSFDLSSLLEKMLPQLIIYAKKKDADINSQIHTPSRISGNSLHLKSVFKQLLYLLVKEIQSGGRIELSSRRENQHQIVTINVYGFLRYDITYEAILNLDKNILHGAGWKVHTTKFFFIYNTLKQNRSKIFINKLSPAHRIISLVLPAGISENVDPVY